MSCIKKPEQNLLSWASFPDGDFVKYFTIDEVGNWFWKENTKEIPQVPQIWLTSSHIVKDGSIVSSSVSLLIGMLIYENDGSEIQKRIYKAFMEQGPTRNPMFKQEHSVLINSVIAQRVTTLKPAEGKWLSQNFYAYRIPIIQLEYNVQGHTEAELLHNQIAAYLYNLKLRTRDQNQQTLFRMYSSEWRDWVLHVTAINALFEKIYYNKLYKDLGKSPKNIVNKLIKESPGCLQMLIKSWKSLWFKDLHFELIIRNMIEDNNNIEFYQHFSDIIRSYGFCNSEKLPVTTRSINNNSFTVNSLGDLPLTPIPFGDVEDV